MQENPQNYQPPPNQISQSSVKELLQLGAVLKCQAHWNNASGKSISAGGYTNGAKPAS